MYDRGMEKLRQLYKQDFRISSHLSISYKSWVGSCGLKS